MNIFDAQLMQDKLDQDYARNLGTGWDAITQLNAMSGRNMGRSIGGLFGLKTPLEAKAEQYKQMAEGVDMSDLKSMYEYANRLIQNGYTEEGLKILNEANSLREELISASSGSSGESTWAKHFDDYIDRFGLDPMNPEHRRMADEHASRFKRETVGQKKEVASFKHELKLDELVKKAGLDQQTYAINRDVAVRSAYDEALNKGAGADEAKRISEKTGDIFDVQAGETAAGNANSLADSLISRADDLMATGGLAAIQVFNPFSDAYNLKMDLETLKAASGLTKLMELKASGATLGQVTEKELAMLQAAYGALQQTQRPEQFKRNLRKFKQAMIDIQKMKRDSFVLKHKGDRVPWTATGKRKITAGKVEGYADFYGNYYNKKGDRIDANGNPL